MPNEPFPTIGNTDEEEEANEKREKGQQSQVIKKNSR